MPANEQVARGSGLRVGGDPSEDRRRADPGENRAPQAGKSQDRDMGACPRRMPVATLAIPACCQT